MNKNPTIYDVAKEAGVSPATVSRVMNHYTQVKRETSEKVIAAIKRLEFERSEAKSAAQRIDSSISRILPSGQPRIFILSIPQIDSPFYVDMIRGAQNAAQKNGHHLLINSTPVNENNFDFFIATMKSHNIAGILTTETLGVSALLKINDQFPLVQCDEYNPAVEQLSYVSIDNKPMIHLADNPPKESDVIKKLYYEIGFQAFEQLLSEFINPYAQKNHILLESKYILQETTI